MSSTVLALLVACWAAASRAACPVDWYTFGTACYGAFEGPANWDEAKKLCEDKGATLASIHSQAENDHAIFACGNTRPFHQGCWVGGTDKNQRHRRWIWADGTTWDYNRWFDHGGGNREPNNDFCSNHRVCTYGHTADCSILEVSKKVPYGGWWLDTFCTDKLKYICKMEDADDNQESGASAGGKQTAPGPPPPVESQPRTVNRPAESGLRRLEADEAIPPSEPSTSSSAPPHEPPNSFSAPPPVPPPPLPASAPAVDASSPVLPPPVPPPIPPASAPLSETSVPEATIEEAEQAADLEDELYQ